MEKTALFGKTLDQLKEITDQLDLPSFNAQQIAAWLYQKDINSFDKMTNISKKARIMLNEHFDFGVYPHMNMQISKDGTKKYLFNTGKYQYIESAYIPENNRSTLCISSQVGCKMGCLFCMTGKQGYQANLSSGDILNQVRSLPERKQLSNIVYMGMGEPFDNIEAVLKSVEILTSEWGFNISPRRVTVSTIGIIPAMRTFIEESNAHLAISLQTPFEEERQQIMPIEKVYPIKEVINVLKSYDLNKQRRISFEYIMFDGFNDTSRHVNELARLLNGLRCRINLIRFHPIPGRPLKGSDDGSIMSFMERLKAKGIINTLRKSRGIDIDAACGLLSTKEKSVQQLKS
ncbi:23S rRNA (adenine(2503)-C(2))-methyltransferase RlmN [Bacteroidota bacterium]